MDIRIRTIEAGIAGDPSKLVRLESEGTSIDLLYNCTSKFSLYWNIFILILMAGKLKLIYKK